MRELEPTEEGHIVRLIKEHAVQPELGRVTKVYEHTALDDNSNFEANVKLRDSDKERRRVPIATTPFLGAMSVPEVGATVLVDFLDGESDSPVIVGIIHNSEDRAPLGQEGIYRLRKGGLYFEMHPDGNWVRMAKKSVDDGEPSAKIELDDTGSITLDGYTPSYTGSFTITETGQQSITGVGFQPSKIEFKGEATGGQNVDTAGDDGGTIGNYQGSFQGQAGDDGHRQVVHSGVSGNSPSNTSHYTSDTECIAIRYADGTGSPLGYLKADVVSWESDGFTIDTTNYQQNEVVTYTAHR